MNLSEKIEDLSVLLEKAFQLGKLPDEFNSEFKKYRTLFAKLGEKKAVFLQLSESLEALLLEESKLNPAILMNVVSTVNKIRLGLSLQQPKKALSEVSLSEQKIHYRNDSWRTLQPIVKALSIQGSGRLQALEQAYLLKFYQNRQLLPYIINACGDSYSRISTLALNDMLPFFGESGLQALRCSLDLSGGKSELAKFIYLLNHLGGDSLRTLQKEAFNQGESDFKREVLVRCKPEHWMAQVLEEMMKSRSRELSRLAKCAFEKLQG